MLGVAAVGMLVVDSLDASSAGNVIFRRCQFELSVVRHVKSGLHESLSVGAGTEDNGAVEVLQTAAGNLTCRCRLAVDEHHDGHDGIDGLLVVR